MTVTSYEQSCRRLALGTESAKRADLQTREPVRSSPRVGALLGRRHCRFGMGTASGQQYPPTEGSIWYPRSQRVGDTVVHNRSVAEEARWKRKR